MPSPFGFNFLEQAVTNETAAELPTVQYDDEADLSVILVNGVAVPFVTTAPDSLSTVIVTRSDADEPKDDENEGDIWRASRSWAATLTSTKSDGEAPDADDVDDPMYQVKS